MFVTRRCIFFELLTMEIAFRGRASKDQLVLLFKTLGKPSEVLRASLVGRVQ
jgi:hypothetical protein